MIKDRREGYLDPITVPPEPPPQLTLEQFRELEAAMLARGYADLIAWSETIKPPRDCRTFAKEVIFVIANSGMSFRIANGIYWRCVRALAKGRSSAEVYGHPGKAKAMDHIWHHRKVLFAAYQIADNKLAFCGTLPFVGPVTRHHLAKNLGVNTVKPDVHLARLAAAEHGTAWELCERLAGQTGYREATIDTILWRACADRFLDSRTYLAEGWEAAFNPRPP
ncbi:hypothetical protein [Sphingomonas turrisvirgatae]|uniref:Uncharacterized protein n=1 Tax=Sphingomonas turrisvirgatae TaxID=1888892 RepID=A0A1E3M0X5_9SPHN|nr:hypothetical protein [Sphingomonas turrisvirgatae]ODP39767.1 hypothetical protein BFL28_09090 [Sphingomonas turrisvirgatae]